MSEHKKVKWGIIGLGNQGEKIAQTIGLSKNGQLAGVFCDSPKRTSEFSQKYRTVGFNCSEDFLKQSGAEAVFISSPNHQHAIHSIAALKAGKHVLCEKPMALSSKEAQEIKEAIINSNRRQFGVGFHLRFHPVFLVAKERIESGVLGKIKLVQMHWSIGRAGEMDFPPLPSHQRWREKTKLSGGGSLMARGVHLFDLAFFLLGQEAEKIFSLSDVKSKKQIDQTTVGVARFGKTLMVMATSRLVPFAINHMTVYGSHGRLFMPEPFTYDGTGTLQITTAKRDTVKKFTKKFNLYLVEIENFSRAILTSKAWSGASADDGIKSVKMAERWSGLKN
ncbi:Gfo/Idh/MocA family oxidoreductase [Patescibacteria group bacterium]|nr:Gfo/Idh/MocA family oxidoreductase [Patescibacteria group bacterium]MBU2264630.1 Gfo/Idh/MocA family oxidoreductase [Patescibacteria group bacterium]